ncbi:retropepsin-like aspartic protease [Telmatobacter bradus]|uniref:retropepsin-like aspartic protease n=1 Tax=Telmatobacter bradus TaxID=474953 RepID=UPI003B42FBEE
MSAKTGTLAGIDPWWARLELRRSRRLAALAFFVFFAPIFVQAQSTPPNPELPDTATAPPAQKSDQPSMEAQVHTGTSTGVEADQLLLGLLEDHQFLQLEQELNKLPADDRAFYQGLLENHANDSKNSATLLEAQLDRIVASGDSKREKLLRKALGEDYLRMGNWSKAAAAYAALEERLGKKLTADEQDDLELPVKLLPLAKNNPPMTIDACDPFQMQVEKNPLGLTDIPVFVDARPHDWMLDPTLPFNMIARSVAREVGLKVSEEAATIHTLTGKPIQVHMAIIPRFTIEGQLTLHNMTAFVFEDADYRFADSDYQVEGVLGLPALMAMGSVTFTGNSTIFVHPAQQIAVKEPKDQVKDGAHFFLDGDQVVVALGKARDGSEGKPTPAIAPGDERMYILDAGSQQTYLTSRYFNEHTNDFDGQKMALFEVPGSEDVPPQPAFTAETILLQVGPKIVPIHYIQVLTQPLGNQALDDVYGVLGIDALDQFGSYTFDYRTMQFSAQPQ